MGQTIELTGADGFRFQAYRAPVSDARRGGLVLIQEIFGVTGHIRDLADAFAADGYETLAPSFFDRIAPGFQADHDNDGKARGVQASMDTPWDQVVGDVQAAIDALSGPVFLVGYCWGGAAAWLAACRCEGLAAVSGYYGRRISELKDETPRVPTILHFGKTDPSIPLERVDEIREVHPDLPIYLYEAGHGFNSDRPDLHDPDSARLARLRTLALFSRNSGSRAEA